MKGTIRKWAMIGMGGLTTLCVASPAFARTITLKDTGLAFWIFVAIGTVIVLLQLVPAAILIFSFIMKNFYGGVQKQESQGGKESWGGSTDRGRNR